MHILIVGAQGQLGRALQAVYGNQTVSGHQTISDQQAVSGQVADQKTTFWSRPAYDIAHPAIAEQVAALQPDVVINAAAWTNVDGAEANPDAAYAANALGPQYLAEGCRRCGAMLVQISTNEVFAGEPGRFYREHDQPGPGSVYARSKLAGEFAARQVWDRLLIVRVAWLFGPGGANFPSKIMAAADKVGALRVVADEFGNPTYAPDVAAALPALIATGRYGIYHLVNGGQANRFELAQAALQMSGRGHIPLTPIAHTEWPRPAPPPLHAVLVNQAAAALDITLRPWQAALEEYVKVISDK